jgi:hypothetical protein
MACPGKLEYLILSRPALRRANARNRGVLKNKLRGPAALMPQTPPTPVHTAGHAASSGRH